MRCLFHSFSLLLLCFQEAKQKNAICKEKWCIYFRFTSLSLFYYFFWFFFFLVFFFFFTFFLNIFHSSSLASLHSPFSRVLSADFSLTILSSLKIFWFLPIFGQSFFSFYLSLVLSLYIYSFICPSFLILIQVLLNRNHFFYLSKILSSLSLRYFISLPFILLFALR